MNPMTFWNYVITLQARVAFVRAHFSWLTEFQLAPAAALPYGALPEFVRADIRVASLQRAWQGPKL